MKKALIGIVILIVIVLAVAIFLKGIFPSVPGIADANDSVMEETPTENVEEQEIVPEEAEETEETEPQQVMLTIDISVVEREYFYQNKKTDLDSFINELNNTEGIFIVEITDDNASLRAYNKLIDALEENSFAYIEK